MPHRPPTRNTLRLIFAAVLLAIAAAAAIAVVRARDTVHALPETFDYLPYRFAQASPGDDARIKFASTDLDGDGISEGVAISRTTGHEEKFIGVHRYSESQRFSILQINLPAKSGLLGVADVNADGHAELIYLQQQPHEDVQFIVEEFKETSEGASRHRLAEIRWDATASHMSDGLWGGDAYLMEVLDLNGDGISETLVVGLSTGIRRYPRGIWLLDWIDGKITRTLGTGGSPTTGWFLVDADEDGRDDIIFGIESPGNGAFTAPFADTAAYVAAVDLDLSLLWWREVAGYSARVDLAVADLDGDLVEEVAVVIGGHGSWLSDDISLNVLRASDGEILVRLPYSAPANAVAAAVAQGDPRLFVGLADGTLRRYSYAAGVLREDGRFENGEGIAATRVVDFGLPSGDPCLLAVTAKGTLIALDLELNPVAAWRTGEAVLIDTQIVPTVFPVGGVGVPGAVVQTQTRARYLYLERVPLPPWVRRAIDWLRSIASFLIVAVATLLVAGTVLPRYRRQAVGALRRRLLPRRRREAELDEFIEQLKTGDHGLLSATKTLRRLAGQFTMLSQHEGEAPPQFSERYAEALRNAREVGLPAVEGLVASAAQLGLAPLEAAEVKQAIEELRDTVGRLPGRPPSRDEADAVRVALDRSLATVQRGLTTARGQAERERSCSPVAELERVISSRGAELRQPGLRLERIGFERLARTRVLGTPAELTFVLDNLIGNSLRAVRLQDEAAIRVTVSRENGTVSLTVEDTGKGIPASEHERVFARGASEKGGGHGLPRSREILERRGGSLDLVRSAPGEGTVFEVRLKAVVDGA